MMITVKSTLYLYMTITLVMHTSNIFELNNDVQYIRLSNSSPYFIMLAALYPFLIVNLCDCFKMVEHIQHPLSS